MTTKSTASDNQPPEYVPPTVCVDVSRLCPIGSQ